jgi:hypothetical protein
VNLRYLSEVLLKGKDAAATPVAFSHWADLAGLSPSIIVGESTQALTGNFNPISTCASARSFGFRSA